jgi:hypothetical protein
MLGAARLRTDSERAPRPREGASDHLGSGPCPPSLRGRPGASWA